MLEIVLTALENPVNLVCIILIIVLAIIDLASKKNFKSQIVSLGVLGTFLGIFMGLQDFNPSDMKNSINSILEGLKTAFFTSIAGMGVALIVTVLQKIFSKDIDDSNRDENILLEISKKLNHLEKLNQTQETDKIIGELERLRSIQTDTRDETQKVSQSIEILKDTSNSQNQELITILNTNFTKMNASLEIAIDKLSKGATEEIIKALEKVIQEFNQELQSSFGDNFVKLNEAVINLLTWQENYKTHIETLDKKLDLSTNSIEKSKESLEIISSKNDDILKVYQALAQMISKSRTQINTLNEELETYGQLSDNAKDMFSTIEESIGNTEEKFKTLTETIKLSNSEQKESFRRDNEEIKKSHTDLTEHIKEGSKKQIAYNENVFEALNNNFEKNKKELDMISNHFKNLGIEIPKSLDISLTELNRGLTSLTTEFQKSYKETLEKYNRGLNNGRG